MATSNGNQDWLELYREAVLEPDRTKVGERVAQAQAAIRLRARELWYAGVTETTERHRMDSASRVLGIPNSIEADK